MGIGAEELWPHLDLVALATVADLVPLTGENRILVRFGLRYLTHTRKVGVRALLEVSGLGEGQEIEAGQVGFVLAPRINAAGRMGDAARALRLLLAEDPAEAHALARELDETNRKRRDEEQATLADALAKLSAEFDPERDFGVVLAGEGWHPGVIGIVASRVVERIHRPVVLVALHGERGRGSARSIAGVHMFRALESAGDLLLRFGGHSQAAGMDVSRERLPEFRSAFNRSVREQLGGVAPRPRLVGDLEIPLSAADSRLHGLLKHVGPFGIGNPRPVFRATGLHVLDRPRAVGRGHLKLRLGDGRGELDAIGFGLADRLRAGRLGGGSVDALFQLRENEYRGARTLQAQLLDLRPSDPGDAGPAIHR
jgi:single-stranded-DNA-specific exonuclease